MKKRKLFKNADMEEKTAKFTISMDEKENIGELIKGYRQYHSLTQEQLAEFIGVSILP